MLQIRLLGQFELRLEDRPVALPTRAGQSLLAYLLLNPDTAHRREKLAGLLWPDSSEANARGYLRHELWRIRKALQAVPLPGHDYLLTDDLSIAFNPQSDYQLDTDLLAGPAATAVELAAAAGAYQGELLPGFYDEWVQLERERLNAVFEQQMQRLLDVLLGERRWQETIDWAERWIALGRVPEPAYRALLVAHGGRGDMPNVLAVYARCQAALRDELGVAPSPQTRQVFETLTAQTAPSSGSVATPPVSAAEASPAPGEPPFKGLQYFEEADAGMFFGRELLIARLVGRLRQDRFLAIIVGASGSGKSSLVRAGLIPALKDARPLADGSLPPAGSPAWHTHVVTPTAHPLEALAVELTRELPAGAAASRLAGRLASDPRALDAHLSDQSSAPRVLLVVDQFEELFTACSDGFEREAFIDNLLAAVAPDSAGKLVVVITLRADFYGHCAQYPALREALARSQEYIGPMAADELRRAIEAPAQQAGWGLEPGLVDLVLRDLGDEPGALPLLSHALLETWKRRRGRTLTIRGYTESGGVRGAIAQTAESTFGRLSPGQQTIARRIFLRLTEPGQASLETGLPSPDTRRRAALNELILRPEEAETTHSVLKALADVRLVVTTEDAAEVAHEALIREWPTLRGWLEENREGLRVHRHLTESAQEWAAMNRAPDLLYRGGRLAQAQEWGQAHDEDLNTLEREFLAAALEQSEREAQEREAQRQRELESAQKLAQAERQHAEAASRQAAEQAHAAAQLRRRALYLSGALIIALILALTAVYLGASARQAATAAQAESHVATSRELAAAAVSNLSDDPERSVLLALQAENVSDTLEAENALHRSILASRIVLSVHHDQEVWSVAYSPDGKRLATASQDKTARVWDAATGQLLLTLVGHTDSVNGIAFSPDGKLIATTSDDHTAKLWDAASGQQRLTLSGDTDYVERVAFSPDGNTLATVSGDGSARIWDAVTGKQVRLLQFTDLLSDVAFSPDGARLATSTGSQTDSKVILWEVSSGKLLLTLPRSSPGSFTGVAFSPDGKRVAAVGDGVATIIMWDAQTGAEILKSDLGLSNLLLDIAFSPDNKTAAVSGLDHKVTIWDTATGQVLMTLAGHTSGVNGVAFSPDGSHLASAGWDGTARIWAITPGKEALFIPIKKLTGGNGFSMRLSYSPDGTRLLTDFGDANSAKIWDAHTGADLLTLSGHTDQTFISAYSSDGKLAAAGSWDKTVIVWDANTGRQLITLRGHTSVVNGIAFSSDGARLVSGSDDNTAIIWDLASGKPLLTLAGGGRPDNGIPAVAFSPDGKHVVTGGYDGTGIVWDAATGAKVLTLSGHTDTIWGLAYSRDGSRIATASRDGTDKIWDAATGKELLTLRGHGGTVISIDFSPDGKWVASASLDGTARIWDAVTGESLLTIPVDDTGVGGVSFSPDGKRLAVGARSGVYVVELQVGDLIALAKSRVTRRLTTDECKQYLHVEVCP